MIDKNIINKYAKINNIKPWQQEKHYIQSLILTTLSEKPIVFKGGTYLWFFHGLNRFSEDLDFTTEDAIKKNLANEVVDSLSLLGVESSSKIITDNNITLSFRIGAKGPLTTGELDTCYVYVEISKRESVLLKPTPFVLDTPAYNLPKKIIQGMHLNEVAAEKVRAIITRKKARDIYDLAFLIDKGVLPDKELIDKKLEYYSFKYTPDEFKKAFLEKEKYWRQELKPLVIDLPEFSFTKQKIFHAMNL